IISLDTVFVHFVHISKPLSDTETASLNNLLNYGHVTDQNPQGHLLLVTPRFGTISPWSSKATDIAHNCGLEKVIRVERETAWYMQTAEGKVPTPVHIEKIKPLIHDRMTEMVLENPDQASAL